MNQGSIRLQEKRPSHTICGERKGKQLQQVGAAAAAAAAGIMAGEGLLDRRAGPGPGPGAGKWKAEGGGRGETVFPAGGRSTKYA